MEEKEKKKAVFTPHRHSLSFDIYEERTPGRELVNALLARLRDSKRTCLTKNADEDFLLGIKCFYSLRYAEDILKMLRESDSVSISIE